MISQRWHDARRRVASAVETWCRDRVCETLERFEIGVLTLYLPDGSSRMFGDRNSTDRATLSIRDPRLFADLFVHGAAALETGYLGGQFETENLPNLLRLLTLNRAVLDRLAPYHRLPPGPRISSASTDPADVALERQCLDSGLHASCGYYGTPEDSLERAQYNTMRILLEKSCLRSSHHVLDAGCGWGAFALEAARQIGCRVTAVVPSEARYDLVHRRVREQKLEERVTVLLKPYAEIAGLFDRVVCVEAPEALAENRLDAFFAACERWLKPEGLVVLQALTVPDRLPVQPISWWRTAWNRFGSLPSRAPSLAAICRSMARHSFLLIEDMENIGAHYPLTLQAWTRRLPVPAADTPLEDVRRLRIWRFDLARFEAAALAREAAVLQLVLSRPGNRSLPTLF